MFHLNIKYLYTNICTITNVDSLKNTSCPYTRYNLKIIFISAIFSFKILRSMGNEKIFYNFIDKLIERENNKVELKFIDKVVKLYYLIGLIV